MYLRTLACLLLSLPLSAQEMRGDEHLLATLPAGIELEGKPLIDPGGKSWPVVHPIIYGPLGERVAYVGEKEGKTHPVIGEQVFEAYDYISRPVFSENGATLAFRIGNRTKKTSETWWVLVDGEPIGKRDWIGAVAVSPDGERLAYWTQPGAKIQRDGAYDRSKQVLVVASKKSDKWKSKKGAKYDDALSLEPPLFSADGAQLMTIAMDKSKWYVLQSGKQEKQLGKGEAMISALAIDAKAKGFAYLTMQMSNTPGGFPPGGPGGGITMPGSKNVLVWGKATLGEKFDSVATPVLSADGKHIAYKAFLREGMGIVLDDEDELHTPFEYVHKPVFDPAGKQLAYVVTEGGKVSAFYRQNEYGDRMIEGGQSHVVRHTVKGKRKLDHEQEWLEIRDLAFSPDGKHLAYAARSAEGWTIVLDGEAGEFEESVGPPRFDAENEQLGYGAREQRELWWRVRALK